MDGSDGDMCGFSVFSKRAKVTKKNAQENAESTEVVKTKVTKEIIKQEDDRLTFKDLGLNEWVVKCCNAMHIVKPTPVQVLFKKLVANVLEILYS